MNFSRRQLLRTGVTAAAVGAAALAVPNTAHATVPNSPRFKLDGAGDNPVLRKDLHENWVMQSFGYDNTNQHIYFVQHSSTDASQRGNLWVTKTDTEGNKQGSMFLRGFGHGVQIGVEPYNGAVYLWTEWKASSSGFGTRIGRFRFVDDTVLDAGDSAIQDRTPSIGDTMVNPQPAIDPWAGRLVVRYKVAADMPRIVVFSLADARAGRLTSEYRLAERALPSRGSWGETNPFQGFAACGRYAYLLEGRVSRTSYLTTIDLNGTGQSTVVDRFATTAGASLPGREPQGMSIWIEGGGTPRLAFGFHSNTSGDRQASVFYKSEFL
jgi:hypothetical protein